MYVKLYISIMEMSQKINFLALIFNEITIFFWENGKKHTFQTPYKMQFWVENAKITWKSS